MYISARADYALRAMLAVADDAGTTGDPAAGGGELVKAASLAEGQDIPLSFLQGILLDLRRAGLLHSHRGTEGGYALTRPPDEISVGDVLRAVGGAITSVRGVPADRAGYHGVATGLRDVWLAVDGAIALVVDRTTLADLLSDRATAP
ncbi:MULTISPECIES: Rrf2 family transcriptional regulator [unclassified Micromonospora]|uniref:RrF2 family transcriptional regulator n=1 Tax=unclassified Micromonospora TaxID=2617518 RepID=UPI001C22F521|nr:MULTISPECIES: Rrf2 family transcriptional regulator [unclassified Micromonospora]MBU8856930.1 Rrf2 family transcriptional regulator [Micromonospora sp. WMMB482]MDM4782547.1 Rrf2 family transcriptional regulator [Micromonospora sp. b486]